MLRPFNVRHFSIGRSMLRPYNSNFFLTPSR